MISPNCAMVFFSKFQSTIMRQINGDGDANLTINCHSPFHFSLHPTTLFSFTCFHPCLFNPRNAFDPLDPCVHLHLDFRYLHKSTSNLVQPRNVSRLLEDLLATNTLGLLGNLTSHAIHSNPEMLSFFLNNSLSHS